MFLQRGCCRYATDLTVTREPNLPCIFTNCNKLKRSIRFVMSHSRDTQVLRPVVVFFLLLIHLFSSFSFNVNKPSTVYMHERNRQGQEQRCRKKKKKKKDTKKTWDESPCQQSRRPKYHDYRELFVGVSNPFPIDAIWHVEFFFPGRRGLISNLGSCTLFRSNPSSRWNYQ